MAGVHASLITCTHPDNLEPYAKVMELWYTGKASVKQICRITGLKPNRIYNIISKYKAPITDRNITLIITSKV